MVSTGIVRNIDEVGRFVIPKEIRKNLCLKEGTKEKKRNSSYGFSRWRQHCTKEIQSRMQLLQQYGRFKRNQWNKTLQELHQ